jgi:hypothetical protein
MSDMTTAERYNLLKKMAASFEATEILPKEARYVDAMRGFDGRPDLAKGIYEKTGMDFSKAASISGAASGTTDKAVIPLYVDPSIIDVTRRLTPLVELIPRVTNYGRTAEFNRLTARGVGGFNIEDAAMNSADDTYARSSVAIKFAYSVGRVTGPYLAATKQYLSQNYVDALNLEVMNKAKTMRFIEEDAILNGSASSSRTAYGSTTTISGTEYNGILNYGSINSNTDRASQTIDIATLRKGIRTARTANDSATLGQGNPDMMVTDFKTLDDIKALLQDYQRIVPYDKIAWGFQTVVFEGLPVIASRFSPTGSNLKAIAVLDSSTWQMRVLQDMTYEELAKTNDSYKFMIKMYEALICVAPEYNTKIITLA